MTQPPLSLNQSLVIASHNAGKVKEIRGLLAPLNLSIISAGELGLPEPEETGSTFLENSQLKALAIAQASGKMALSDDSGLCVKALDGAPGIYSGRWAQRTPDGSRDFKYAFEKIFEALHDKGAHPPYRAQMVCVLSLADPTGSVRSFEGIVKGTLSLPPRGDKGFGYDPIFTPDGYDQTFAQDPDLKTKLSHRQRAFDLFLKDFRGESMTTPYFQ